MIRILPEILANKIAAGEVVVRPAAVVKELVENALDAGATKVLVEIANGGKSLIRVSDNGRGMNHDDTLLSIERYATSKIKTDRDLFAITTMGFRGEALPSIAAVSRFALTSCNQEGDAATRVQVAGGKILDVKATGAPRGTVVEVADLFFNLPARRKFLKSTATEAAHIADGLTASALAYPQVTFTLVHNGKTIKSLPAAAAAQRVAEVVGRDLAAGLIAVDRRQETLAVAGWIGTPETARASFSGFWTYVNGRPVRDRVLQQAVINAYQGRLMKGRFPVAVIFVTLPADRVDVNVHPAKHEVRFAEPAEVFGLVTGAVSQALVKTNRIPSPGPPRPVPPEPAPPIHPYPTEAVARSVPVDFAPVAAPLRSALLRVQESLWQTDRLTDLAVIGLFDDTYILCQGTTGLVLVDQHAAHERVVYETLKRAAAADRPPSQRLLLAQVVELSHRQADALAAVLPALGAVGFDIALFGGASVAVTAVPAILAGRDLASLLADLADAVAATGTAADVQRLLDETLQTMACHRAIRAGQTLDPAQIKALLAQLDACDDPAHCPHGRPTWIVLDRSEIERRFGRRGPGLL